MLKCTSCYVRVLSNSERIFCLEILLVINHLYKNYLKLHGNYLFNNVSFLRPFYTCKLNNLSIEDKTVNCVCC